MVFAADSSPETTGKLASRVPTHVLGDPPPWVPRRGYSGPLPRVPQPVAVETPEEARERRITTRRRRLLAIFGRMMARFHEHHERRWSMGRWQCLVCHRRIVAWAWLPARHDDGALHEECISRSMWDLVLTYEYLAMQGRASSPWEVAAMARR